MKVRLDVARAVRRRVPAAARRVLVRRWTAAARRLGVDPQGVCARIVDDEEMARLNRQHMQQRGPTDVLSFPAPAQALHNPSYTPPGHNPPGVVGDVVVDWDAASRQAAGRPVLDEVTDLGVHGLAHLLGHDHDQRAQARAMLRAENRACRAARIPMPRRPYGGGVG